MRWYTYDTETFSHDFIVVFKDKETGEERRIDINERKHT